jgi:hypothetical protein
MSYRTAQGKTLDMAALVSKNETARAVGNMKVNARGDTIDSEGNVIVPVTEKVADSYAKTVGNRSAQGRTRLQPNPPADTSKMELSEEEKELLSVDESDIEVEEIKAKETKK